MTLLLAFTHLIIAVVTIAISVPLVKEKIPMNRTYGVRIARAFESESNWYRINKYGGKALILWSLPVFLIGVFLLILNFKSPISPWNIPLVTLFSLTPLILMGALPQTLMWTKRNIESTDLPG